MPVFKIVLRYFLAAALFALGSVTCGRTAQADAGTSSYPGAYAVITADRQYQFAQELFAQGHYDRAVAEYQRFVFFFPADQRVEQALFEIGRAYVKAGDFEAAIQALGEVTARYEGSRTAVNAYLLISECHMQLNAPGPAVINLKNLIALSDQGEVRDEAYYRIGWIYIETGAFDDARRYLDQISDSRREYYRLEPLLEDLAQARQIPAKNPHLAGVLSIVPGAGFLYCERYQDALVALLVNGGLMAAAYEAFDDDHPALGGVLAFVEFGFYAGNIYGAVSSAHKYNHSQTGRFIDRLKTKNKINLSAGLHPKGPVFALRWAF